MKILKFLLGLILLFSVLLIFVVVRIDRIPFEETEHYKAWREVMADFPAESFSDNLEIGWAVQNITPEGSAPLAGYGKRKGKHFESVNDSVYVRAIAVGNEERTIYFVSADLLFIPPTVINLLEEQLSASNINLRDVHFSATHSHSSLGGWEKSPVGWIFGGKYDEAIVLMLADRFYKAIMDSSKDMLPGEIAYSEVIAPDNVRNRVDNLAGVKDNEIRSLTFTKDNGEQAYLITYAAHSTVYGADMLDLSRDYSGVLLDSLSPDFGMYMAGAVASMGPVGRGDSPEEKIRAQADGILNDFKTRNEKLLDPEVWSEWIEIPLPEPKAKITKNWALRPWVFKRLFGDYKVHIKVTKIGSTLFLGMPADFSGEIMVDLDKYATAKGIDLVITSFNGGYIGYITDDKIYDSGHYETTMMSWYGYQVGGYFKQVSKEIIDKIL